MNSDEEFVRELEEMGKDEEERPRITSIRQDLACRLMLERIVFRFGIYLEGINSERRDAIQSAIREYFPDFEEDCWWWKYYQHEHVLLGEVDGADFDEEAGSMLSPVGEDEIPWMDRVAARCVGSQWGLLSRDVATRHRSLGR